MMVFDEYKYAEKLLKEGFIQPRMKLRELQILTNYFRVQEFPDDLIEETLHAFLLKHLSNYNRVKFQGMVDNAITFSKKQKLKVANEISITDKEWETITSEDDVKVQKLLFIYLVLAKYFMSNNHSDKYYVGIKDADLWKLCKFYTRKVDRIKLLQYITNKEYITPTLNMSSVVNYIQEGTPIIKFIPCEDMIYYFDSLKGARIIFCDICGKIEKPNSGAQKHCKSCARLIKNKII